MYIIKTHTKKNTKMGKEQKLSTLVLFKPMALKRNGVNPMLKKLCAFGETQGFSIAELKTIRLKKAKWREFYSEHKEKPFYNLLVDFMASRKVVAIRIEYDENDTGFINRFRTYVIGATDPNKAAIGTMRSVFGSRKEFAEGLPSNGIHASDSRESAQRELKFFFRNFKA